MKISEQEAFVDPLGIKNAFPYCLNVGEDCHMLADVYVCSYFVASHPRKVVEWSASGQGED